MSRPEKERETVLEDIPSIAGSDNCKEDSVTDLETSCGVGSCAPLAAQRCANVAAFTWSAGLNSLFLQMMTTYLASQVTTLEKQFGLSSTESGILLTSNEIGFLSLILMFSHFGRKSHMPRILAVTAIIYGLAGIVCGLPQFIEPTYLPKFGITDKNLSNDVDSSLCSPKAIIKHPNNTCKVDQSGDSGSSHWVFYLLAISFAVQGASKSPRNPLTTVYIDNNVRDKKKTGLFLGLANLLNVAAPGLAFIFGGIFNRIPVDLQDTLLTPTDARWIGAWWLGFLICGGVSVVITVPLFFFPRRLKGSWKESEKIEENSQGELNIWQKIKGLPTSLMRVVMKPVYMLTLACTVLTFFSISGYIAFGAKYMETVLLIPAWKTNVLLGIQATVATSSGTLLGGYLTTRFRLNTRDCLKVVLALITFSTVTSALYLIFGCTHPFIYGLQSHSSEANANSTVCECSDVRFLPVCGVNTQRTYFSPCHAGCRSQNKTIYDDCILEAGSDVSVGMCDTGCPYLYPFVFLSLVYTVATATTIVPGSIILLRSVEEEDKSMAIGFQGFITSLLGFLPAPVVFGKLIDTTCKLWNDTCGTRGSCALYDIVDLRMKMFGVIVGLRVAASGMILLAFLVKKYILKSDEKDPPKHSIADTTL